MAGFPRKGGDQRYSALLVEYNTLLAADEDALPAPLFDALKKRIEEIDVFSASSSQPGGDSGGGARGGSARGGHGYGVAAAEAVVMAQQEVLPPLVGGSRGRKGIEEKVVIRREGMRKVHRVAVAMWVVARLTQRTMLQLRVWLRCCLRMWTWRVM